VEWKLWALIHEGLAATAVRAGSLDARHFERASADLLMPNILNVNRICKTKEGDTNVVGKDDDVPRVHPWSAGILGCRRK
jgi:hypothetical protein